MTRDSDRKLAAEAARQVCEGVAYGMARVLCTAHGWPVVTREEIRNNPGWQNTLDSATNVILTKMCGGGR